MTIEGRVLDSPLDPDTNEPIGTSHEDEAATLRWLHAAIREGESILRSDPSYEKMDKTIDYVLGNQYSGKRPSYISDVVVNKLKKALKAHVSALTDLRPLFAFKTYNEAYKKHADLLNQLTVLWWVNTFADLDVADALRYSLTLATGYIVVDYDPNLGRYGDIRLIPKDPRDVLPYRPSRDRSVQSWQGVIIREAVSINALKALYPDKAHLIVKTQHAIRKFSGVKTAFRRIRTMITPVTTLDGLKSPHKANVPVDEVPTFRTYFRDHTVNTTSQPIAMGNPASNWSYVVPVGGKLYPRGRLLVATEHLVLYDGPNPYWHGLFPVVKLTLDPWPWLLLGLSLAHDLLPAQEAINKITNDFLGVLSQSANRGTAFDKNAVPDSVYRAFDARKPGFKLKTNPVFGEAFKMIDPAQLPPWALEFFALMLQEFDSQAGVANLQALLRLRQSPSAETIEKYWEALTPEIRIEGRLLEAAIRELADMVKCNFFQFYSEQRRILLLGDSGSQLEDLDYDPHNLVPDMRPEDPGYSPELDGQQYSRDDRARFFMNQFVFFVAPNSLLALNASQRKMMYMQLARMGYMDFWSLMEMLEIPNVGSPLPVPLPTGEMEVGIDPQTGLPGNVPEMEVRVPTTITERLIAQQTLGIAMATSPAGRKASGQKTPTLETKKDDTGAPRTTITES